MSAMLSTEQDLDTNDEFIVLTEMIRKQYVQYLERQLVANVQKWAKQSKNNEATALASIPHCVRILENQAVQECMAAPVYQRSMIKIISSVRRTTEDGALYHCESSRMALGDDNNTTNENSKCFVNKCTQTFETTVASAAASYNNYEDLSLDRKIDLFEASQLRRRRCRRGRKRKLSTKMTMESPISEPEVDTVANELAILFGDDEETDFNDIFGIPSSHAPTDPQITAILQEIENSELPDSTTTASVSSVKAKVNYDLRNSPWPCELYAQRRNLNACLVRLLDTDWRYEDILRYKFRVLFGDDSDDEFAIGITSPSIDMVDEVLLASCMRRIRPWIVRYLMGPLGEGLIANRILFKKLAKQLAHNVVLVNPYAMESQIKQAIEHFFCMRPMGIQSAFDLDDLPPVYIDRFFD